MPRVSSGTVFEKPIGSGRWYGKFTTTRGRKSVALVTCKSQAEAEQRRDFIAEQLNRLAEGGREEFAGKLLELAAKATTDRHERVRRGVDAIIAGNFEVPRPDDLPDAGPTFQEFAESWTRGDLHRLHPDHVPIKRTVSDDIYRLKSHIYPVVGSTPLRGFSAEHADLVMRALPSDLAPASRRHHSPARSSIATGVPLGRPPNSTWAGSYPSTRPSQSSPEKSVNSPELPKEPETTRAPLANVKDFDRSRLLALVQTLLGSVPQGGITGLLVRLPAPSGARARDRAP